MDELDRVRPHAAHLPGNVPAYSTVRRVQNDTRNQTAVLDANDVGAITRGNIALQVQVYCILPLERRALHWDLSGPRIWRGDEGASYKHGPYA